MAVFHIPNVSVVGVSACVPSNVDRNIDSPLHTKEECEKLIASIGVREKRIAGERTTTSDLCEVAARKLIEELGWEKNEIEGIIFVSQTPDYILPATSCILQEKLGLTKECFTLDVSLGCSGWVYGLNTITALIATGGIKKALLLVGDTTSKTTSKFDKASWPLFGDAGTATAIEFNKMAKGMVFHSATDGSGSEAIIIPDGGYRNSFNQSSLHYYDIDKDGGKRTNLHCKLEGMDVFSFAISKVPKSVKKILSETERSSTDIDYYLFHQANHFLNETIRKKLKLEEVQVPYNMDRYGNTSCASIPLLMVTELRQDLREKSLRLIGCGFGVGLSWNTVYFETDKIICPDLIEYKE